MADNQRPPDDDDEDLDVPDLGVLGEGVTPSYDQWQSIVAEAGHRRSRRAWVLSAAAAVVLIAIAATVVLTRSGESGDLATGGGDTPEALYVIPAEGSVVTSSQLVPEPMGGYLINYSDDSGGWSMQAIPTRLEPSTPVTDPPVTTPTITMESARFGTIQVFCSATDAATGSQLPYPPTASFRIGGHTVLLRGGEPEPPCDPGTPAASALLAQIDRLRVVDEAGLRAFLGITTDDEPLVTSTPPELQPGTTTLASDPVEQGDDRAQIEAAINGFDTQAADGTWPYLEDGVARAAEYKARQDAGSAAVGRTAEDKAGQVHTIISLTFVSDDEADVHFDIAVTLHGQRSTYQHVARVFRQDGHWVMSRDSWFVISSVACGSSTYRNAYPDSCR